MILLIILGLVIVPPIGGGIAVFVKEDARCRKEHKPTRIRGAMLEVYCDEIP